MTTKNKKTTKQLNREISDALSRGTQTNPKVAVTSTSELKLGDFVKLGNLPAYAQELGLPAGAIARVSDVRDDKTFDVNFDGETFAELSVNNIARR